jgi:anti-sigma regulatory factor (Ser/Thr protein kinase)
MIHPTQPTPDSDWQILDEFNLPSQPGYDRMAMAQVAAALQPLHLPASYLERLKTAVAEATLNAIEHGNQNQPDLPVSIRVLASANAVAVQVTDQGDKLIPPLQKPDLSAQVAGRLPARGWGFFLIQKMVDDLRISGDESHHVIELFLYLEGT